MNDEAEHPCNYLSINLLWLLKEHNLNMAELARRCNLSLPVLYRVVQGTIRNPQLHTLLPIAEYFDCSLFTDQKICEYFNEKIGINISFIRKSSTPFMAMSLWG